MKWNNFLIASCLVGLLSFGGGKAFLPIYEKIYVNDYHIITQNTLQEYIGYAISFPGPISPILTGLVGFEQFGFIGFLLGILLLTLPPLCLVFLAYLFLRRWQNHPIFYFIHIYIQAIILALLCSIIIEFISPYIIGLFKLLLLQKPMKIFLYLILIFCFGLTFFTPNIYYRCFCIFLVLVLILYLLPDWSLKPSNNRNILIYLSCILGSFIALYKYKIHPLVLIIISGTIGAFLIYI